MSRFTDTLNAQIGNEFGASQQYVAIAVWYDAETLPQLAAYFYRQAVEERNHAMMLVQYLLDAGEEVVIPGIAAPQTAFAGPVEPVALALAQERRVTEQISALVEIAREEAEPDRRAVPPVVPQGAARGDVQHERAPADRGASAAEHNILLAEDYLARTAGGEAGVEADAPRAAGGAL